MDLQLTRKCPKCPTIISYKTAGNMRQAEKEKTLCRACATIQSRLKRRQCPGCNKWLKYTTVNGCLLAKAKGTQCNKCAIATHNVKVDKYRKMKLAQWAHDRANPQFALRTKSFYDLEEVC